MPPAPSTLVMVYPPIRPPTFDDVPSSTLLSTASPDLVCSANAYPSPCLVMSSRPENSVSVTTRTPASVGPRKGTGVTHLLQPDAVPSQRAGRFRPDSRLDRGRDNRLPMGSSDLTEGEEETL